METIKQQLREFIVENFLFGRMEGTLNDDTSFLESGIIDSTGILELIGFLGRKYGIELYDEEIVPENLDSVGRLATFVHRKLAGQLAAGVMLDGGVNEAASARSCQ